MAKSNKIVVDLRGPKTSRAPLPDFSTVCSSLHACLANVGRNVGLKKSPDFSVSDLRMGSAIMEVEPTKARNGAGEIVSLFQSTLVALEEGRDVDARLDYKTLHCFNGFSAIAKKRDASLKIGGVQLTDNYANNLSALLDPISTALGSVTGQLEAVTVHNRRVFTLFPPIPQEEIDCSFEQSELARVLDAIDRQVTVYGTLHYAKSKIFPVRVDVEEFEILESTENLPSLLEAKGLLPPLSTDNPLLDRTFSDEWH